MKLLAHRGWWTTHPEHNQPSAFERALTHGYGIETDLRDWQGQLVIAHNPPAAGDTPLLAEAFFQQYRQLVPAGQTEQPLLALNIKADGLTPLLLPLLERYHITNYFTFDAAVPDAYFAAKAGLKVFSRLSEIEPVPALPQHSIGLWLDCFQHDWFDEATVLEALGKGLQVALVSPELHKRPHLNVWQQWLETWSPETLQHPQLSLCTDHPAEAEHFFAKLSAVPVAQPAGLV